MRGAADDPGLVEWTAWMGRLEAKLDAIAEVCHRLDAAPALSAISSGCPNGADNTLDGDRTAGLRLGAQKQPTSELLESDVLFEYKPMGPQALPQPLAGAAVEASRCTHDSLNDAWEIGGSRSAKALTPAQSKDIQAATKRATMATRRRGSCDGDGGPRCGTPSQQSLTSQASAAPTRVSRLRSVVESQKFDLMVTLVIVGNALLIGAQVQNHAVSDTPAKWFDKVELACTLIFTVELILRIVILRTEFLSRPFERWWNLFDSFLVCVSWMNTAINILSESNGLPDSSANMIQIGRVVRMLRIVRIIRTVRFLSQLRIILVMVLHSMQSLFWILVTLVGTTYTFAIIITQGSVDYLAVVADGAPAAQMDELRLLRQRFGSLFSTMYTLFQCISGGLSWGEASTLLRSPGWVLEAVTIGYVFFMVFAVLNIVNGVFVDGAIELANRDREMLVQKQKAIDSAKMQHLVELLRAMDEDGDDTITLEEWENSLEREDVGEYLAALNINIHDAKEFFRLLDADDSGSVDIAEFVMGMMKLSGHARSTDINILLHQNWKLMAMIGRYVEMLRPRDSAVEGNGLPKEIA